ncbi:HTH-type transcriptional regulator CysL [Oceanobacillus oncorhynchi]|uniref:HTH-type transcriptional regulator CysL n=1 Tax=Oceanobacillus oncorhynchi TaxID=545501 RepID=A0A0A1MV44_9BACI|nr:LysR family transcriptional regulator [Oceanobacillus oncorhynchi]CEI83312.1 HTH-type transcriptional regulator CysL [Oceanobacillus oncorhynchi]
MNINWLRTFIMAAESENFRKTAEKLYMAQPTVTAHIKQLERDIGTQFFSRSGRNIILTEAGRRFLPHARLILSSYDRGTHDLLAWEQGYKRKLTIAISPLLAASILPYIIRQFMERHMDVEVIVQIKESMEISEMIEKGEADLGLLQMKPVQGSLQVEKIKEDDVICVCSHDGGDLESSPPIDIHDLFENQTLFTYNHPEYWDDLLNAIHVKYHKVRTMVVTQVHITKKFIEEGLGFSFLPKIALNRELIEGRLLEVRTPELKLPKASTYIVTRADTEENRLFQDFLGEYFSY